MFKDTKEGQTHSYNDSCGEPEHNDVFLKTNNEWEKSLETQAIFAKQAKAKGFTEDQAEFLWMLYEKIKMAGVGFPDLFP